jgi:hypothetical protein
LLPRGLELRWGIDSPSTQPQPFRLLYLLDTRPLATGLSRRARRAGPAR